jgi:hypothetical protein
MRIDTSSLTYTHFLSPEPNGGWVDGADAPTFTLDPGIYGFRQISGVAAEFKFKVTPAGLLDYASANDGFLDGRGTTTLTVRGFAVTLDGTRLSHDVLPIVIGATTLPRDRIHELSLAPAAAYRFQPAGGIVADFQFGLDTDGRIIVDPRYSGFSQTSERTLTINGYPIMIDGRRLSHALLPAVMLSDTDILPNDRPHQLTYMPAAGYRFKPAPGIIADFRFGIDTDGRITIDPIHSGFAHTSERTLTINGYQVTLDTRELSHAVLPSLLGFTGAPLSPGVNELTVIPASGYRLQAHQSGIADFRFDLDIAGRTALTDAPDGVSVMSSRRRCGVPDAIVTGLQIQTYGSPGGRWSRRALTFSINPAGVSLPPGDAVAIISGAFGQWQTVAGPLLTLRPVASNGDIQASFGDGRLDARFGKPGGVAGIGRFPEQGRLGFDSKENWTDPLLLSIALHEIGHTLGLSHSNDPASLMYPFDMASSSIDAESADALRRLYGWTPQTPLRDRATSDRPALAVAGQVSFTVSSLAVHMVWKGSRDDPRFFESTLQGGGWSPQKVIEGPYTSTHSPSLASLPLPDGASLGLMLAWKGLTNRLVNFATNDGTNWSRPEQIPGAGSTERPAIVLFGGAPFMAWKGVQGDQGIYWSTRSATGWEPQENVRGVGTTGSPVLVVLRDRLYMFWKGIEGDSKVYYSWRSPADPIWHPQRIVAYADTVTAGGVFREIGTSHGPSATVDGDRILLAWKGAGDDKGLYFSLFDGDQFTGQIRMDGAGTTQGPAVCNFRGTTHMAWKGVEDDNVIYWSAL